jgi:hypothetical protein
MAESLWPQLRLKAGTEEELIELYRQVYLLTYVRDESGVKRSFIDWTGAAYQFSEFAFDHAFSRADNYRTSAGVHNAGFCPVRLRRILWIKEVLALSAGTVARYKQERKSDRGTTVKRRTLVVLDERYVVVFNDPSPHKEAYEFVTAFVADNNYLADLKKKSFLVETKTATPEKEKPQSYGD